MIIKSLNSREIENLKEYPTWVKESVKAFCFITISNSKVIEVDNSDSQDLNDANAEFDKMIRETPDVPIYVIGTDPVSVVRRHHPTYQLPRAQWPEAFAKKALEELKEIHLVEDDLQEDVWLYIFGYAIPNPQSTAKIKWLRTKENLRQFLDLWFEEEFRIGRIKRITYGSLVPFCFVDKKGNPMHLAKARGEESPIPALIDKIFRPNENN